MKALIKTIGIMVLVVLYVTAIAVASVLGRFVGLIAVIVLVLPLVVAALVIMAGAFYEHFKDMEDDI